MCNCESKNFAPRTSFCSCESEKIIERPVCRCEIQKYLVKPIYDCCHKERYCEPKLEKICCQKPCGCKPSCSAC
ncbi:MAG: hypothetical protein LBJ32_00960 [Oscillospiraceae bacterium]|nr:hypothetical protein [Oscillospiraceae bacterium]